MSAIDVKALGKVAVLMGGTSAEREISLLVHVDRSLSPAAQNFRDLLLARHRQPDAAPPAARARRGPGT